VDNKEKMKTVWLSLGQNFLMIFLIVLSNGLTFIGAYVFFEKKIASYENQLNTYGMTLTSMGTKLISVENNVKAVEEELNSYRTSSELIGNELTDSFNENLDAISTYHNNIAPYLEVMSQLEIIKDGPISLVSVKNEGIKIERMK